MNVSTPEESATQSAEQTAPPVQGNQRIILVALIGIVLLALIFSGAYVVFSRNTKGSEQTANPSSTSSAATPTTTPAPMPQPTPIAGGTLFYSEKLGISFSYAKTYADYSFSIKEDGSTVHVYNSDKTPDIGQYVEVFAKNRDDTIEQAITKIILKGYDPKDCPIGYASTTNQATSNSSSYVTASISWTKQNLGQNFVPADESVCPSQYVAVNGIRYFLMDRAHPDKLLFFEIGQYPMNASTDTNSTMSWQDTINVY